MTALALTGPNLMVRIQDLKGKWDSSDFEKGITANENPNESLENYFSYVVTHSSSTVLPTIGWHCVRCGG